MSSLTAAQPAPPAHAAENAAATSSFLDLWPGPILAALSLLVSCILYTARGRQVVDESYTHAELGDPSFFHLWHALPRLGAGGMPLYYLTLWPWSRLFGSGDLALRLYSSLSLALALVLLTLLLRRRLPAQAAFLGVAFGFLTSLMILDENVECRGYGLYVLLAVLAIAAWLRVAETPKPRPRDLALLTLTQAALVLGHVLALLYAGLLLLALLVLDRLNRRFRPRVYLCLLAGWLALIPWIPVIRSSMAVGRPRSWIPMPGLGGLLTGLTSWIFTGFYWPALKNHPLVMMAPWLAAFLIMAVLVVSAVRALRSGPSARRPLLLLGLALAAAPVLFFTVSHLIGPVFIPRYMILSALGVAVLAAAWLERHPLRNARVSWILAAILLFVPIASAAFAPPANLDVASLDRIAAGRPIVCDWSRDFLILDHYDAHPARFQYLLDWPSALAGPRVAVTDVHLMQNYRAAGYFPGQLPDVSQVLARPSFLLLDSTEANWFQLRIAHNPQFTWKLVAPLDSTRRVLLITRVPAAGAQQ